MFITGSDRVPPNGFHKMIKIKFFDSEEGVHRRPSASTCALELYLPRGVSDTDYFNELMTSSLRDSMGFGKFEMYLFCTHKLVSFINHLADE